jgi:hypothetical protein
LGSFERQEELGDGGIVAWIVALSDWASSGEFDLRVKRSWVMVVSLYALVGKFWEFWEF